MRHIKRMVPLIVVALFGSTYGFSGGDGSPENPYEIANVADLLELYDFDPNNGNNFRLVADIDLDPLVTGLPPFTTAVIARDPDNSNSRFDGRPFTGVFDGDGHAISNLTINSGGADNDYLGLFGKIKYGRILNLHLETVTINGGNASKYIGGLVGTNWYGTILNCSAVGNITGSSSLGGLVGENYNDGMINNSSAAISITGISYLGGLVGENSNGIITNCYATGSIIGNIFLGGLSGSNFGMITNCYATGSVTGTSYLGGLVGYNDSSLITHGYYLDPSDGGSKYNGIGESLTDAQMRQQASFVGWDFVNETANGTSQVWMMPPNGGYPVIGVRNGYYLPMPVGSGTPDDPYLLEEPNDMAVLYHYPCTCCKLVTDIDLAGITWSHAPAIEFSGYFDGQGHTISDLHIQGGGLLGLFGRLTHGAVLTDIHLADVNIVGGNHAWILGSLVGYNQKGTITNCSAVGNITGGYYSSYLGGLVGYNNSTITNSYAAGSVGADAPFPSVLGGLVGMNYGVITNCSATSNITGGHSLGGLVGENSYGSIIKSNVTGNVQGGSYVGGMAGRNYYGTIIESHAAGNIEGSSYLGGLVGRNYCSTIIESYATISFAGYRVLGGLVGQNYASIINCCYANGSVTGYRALGGLVGENYSATITKSYATGNVTGDSYVGGLVGASNYSEITNAYFLHPADGGGPINGIGEPLTDAQMRQQASFVGWDFVAGSDDGDENIWAMPINGGYPILTWQGGCILFVNLAGEYGITILDYAVFAAAWQATDGKPHWNADCDLDENGIIDLPDLCILLEHWLNE